MNGQNEDLVYTVKEAAQIMKTSQNIVRQLITSGELPYLKLGNVKIRRSAIENLLVKLEEKEAKDNNNKQEAV